MKKAFHNTNMDKSFFVGIVGILLAVAVGWFLLRSVSAQEPLAAVLYYCDHGANISAVYYSGETKPPVSPDMPPTPGGKVAIKLSDGRSLSLLQTLSADGIRYASADESFVFWSKGDGALVLENGQEKTFIGCIKIVPEPAESGLSQIYSSGSEGFSLRFPKDYTVDGSYRYQELGPDKDIVGIKFTIPAACTAWTNLSPDSYLSVEEIPQVMPPAQECSAELFLERATAVEVTDRGITYSVASSIGAGAGNRYEETVYAFLGTNPCIAVRYFIHYGVIENYPEGAVHEFDKQALLNQFDAIRRTLVIVQ
jgi:hypothetical protein